MLQQDFQEFRRSGRDLRVLAAGLQFRREIAGAIQRRLNGIHQPLAVLGPDEAIRDGSELIVVILAAGFLAGDFLNRIVLQDTTPRLVEFLGQLFTPGSHCDDQGGVVLFLVA